VHLAALLRAIRHYVGVMFLQKKSEPTLLHISSFFSLSPWQLKPQNRKFIIILLFLMY